EAPDLTIDGTTESGITLSWDNVDYADEYVLKRDGVEVYRGPALSFEDQGLTPNTSYGYTLAAVNARGASDETAQSATTVLSIPAAPDLTIDGTTETSITLSWDDVAYADEYVLKRDG